MDPLVERFAVALAREFTGPTCRFDRATGAELVEHADPAERTGRTMRSAFSAPDGDPGFSLVTCGEAAEVCAAVHAEETGALRAELEEYRRRFGPLAGEKPENLEGAVRAAIKEGSLAERDAGDGLVCEVYLEETARRVAAEVRRFGPPGEAEEVPGGRLLTALRDLHVRAGKPSRRSIAAGAGCVSHTTVSQVLKGVKCPSWPVLACVVEQLGGDVEEFRTLWVAAQKEGDGAAEGAGGGSPRRPSVRPGSLWANGVVYRVVELDGDHHVVVEALTTLGDPPGSGERFRVHIGWLDGGLFLGRLIQG